MYNFLMIVGIIFIILGLYGDRTVSKGVKSFFQKEEAHNKELEHKEATNINIYVDDKYIDDIDDMEDKVDIIVDEPINDYKDEEEITFEEVLESVENNIPSNDNEAFDIIEKFEAGEYTLEEICNMLNMKKGEVLLLRNIYKKSQV